MNNQLETLHKLRSKIDIQPRGLIEKEKLTDKEFANLFKSLRFTQESMLFLIGDYLNMAEKRYGKGYKSVVTETGYSPNTLWNAKWVCKNLPITKRHPDLSYSHHYEALILTKSMGNDMVEPPTYNDDGTESKPPVLLYQVAATNYLNKAAEDKLTVAKMRKFIRQTMAGVTGNKKKTDDDLDKRDKAFADVQSYIQYLTTTITSNDFTDNQLKVIKGDLTRLLDNL